MSLTEQVLCPCILNPCASQCACKKRNYTMFKLVLSLSINENNVFVATEETGYLVSEQHFIGDRPVELQ